MRKRTAFAFALTVLLPSAVHADTTIVSEDFDSYADQSAFEAVWVPDDGNGNSPLGTSTGFLVPNTGIGLVPPNDDPPGIQGQAVDILGDINEYSGPATAQMATLAPTATSSVKLSADFFDDVVGNKRDSVGIRNKTTPSNIIEMGFWNADDTDPIDPNIVETGTGYAYRVILFGALGGDLVAQPNWGYFPLDPALDRPDDADEVTTSLDIGQGWHRYTATISLTEVTFTLDLFRDGLANTEATEGVGVPGVDSTVTWPIAPFGAPDPFNSLRIGAPSGITSAHETVVDNVLLELVDVGPPMANADFDDDGDVDGKDFLAWQAGFGIDDGTALHSDGDANGDGNVLADDLSAWQTQFGTSPLASITAIPEPTTILHGIAVILGMSMTTFRYRR